MDKNLQFKIIRTLVGTGLGLLVNVLSSLIAASLFEGTWPNILWVVFAVIGGVAGYLLNGSAVVPGIIAERIESKDEGVEVVGQRGKDITARDIQAKGKVSIRDEVPDGEIDPKKPIAPDEGAGASQTIEAKQFQAGGDIQVGTFTFNQYATTPTGKPLQKPGQVPHFINREAELDHLLKQIQPGQVAAVCGAGGMGKTALVSKAIWELAPENEVPALFPDGIIFHSFYNKPQVSQALEWIAVSLGEKEGNLHQAAQQILPSKQLLLCFDGTEEADDLDTLLKLRGQCGVVITSRKKADARFAEVPRDLLPLAQQDSINLLKDIAGGRAAPPDTVERICDIVDGLPLALRLIGLYLREKAETAAEYLRWLEETPIEALSHGEHREDSVAVLLERSVAQLGQRGQQVLVVVGALALSPFSWEVVAAGLAWSERQVKEGLGELVSYGLVWRDEEKYEVSHALIHTYARESLEVAGEVLRRLGEYYEAFASEESGQGLAGYWRLDEQRDHILRVLSGLEMKAAWAECQNLVWAIDDYLDIRGYGRQRVEVLGSGIKAAQALADRRDEGAFLGNLGGAYYQLGEVEKAISYYEQALAISLEIGDRRVQGNPLGNLGLAYRELGEVEKAISYHEQALAISLEIGDQRGQSSNLSNLGDAYYQLREVEKAISYYEQALAIAQEIGDRRVQGAVLGNLGNAYRELREVEKAISYYEKCLAIVQEIGDRRVQGNHLGNLGLAYRELGEVEKAISYYKKGLAIAQEIGDRRNEGSWLGNLGNAYYQLGEVEKAISYYEQALAIAQEIGDRHNEGLWLGGLGIAYFQLRQVEKARDYLQQAFTILSEIKSPKAALVQQLLEALDQAS